MLRLLGPKNGEPSFSTILVSMHTSFKRQVCWVTARFQVLSFGFRTKDFKV